ncbi:MAG: carboxypeptidase-like regulatory domain-containing protein [Marinilabiliales bacterium]|nr:carboxypeptidase-like regulatory domain-containing protein [Marinilabiliales bacterium]
MPFANISLVGRSIGTITNEEGVFSFKIPSAFKDEDVGCTYMGYKNSIITCFRALSYEIMLSIWNKRLWQ